MNTVWRECNLTGIGSKSHRSNIQPCLMARIPSRFALPFTKESGVNQPVWNSEFDHLSGRLHGFMPSCLSATISLVILVARIRILDIRRREKEKRNLLYQINELEQKALGALMNPHFIFNSLNSIQHYLNVHEKEAANEYLAQFARLVRMNMEVARQNLTPLDEELQRLELYLSLEKLRFGEQFSYKIDIGARGRYRGDRTSQYDHSTFRRECHLAWDLTCRPPGACPVVHQHRGRSSASDCD